MGTGLVRIAAGACALVIAAATPGCGSKPAADPKPAGWRAEVVGVVDGLDIPESFAIDRASGCVYVSNCSGDPEKTWEDDGDGFISRISPEGEMLDPRWLESRAGAVLNDPKGLAVLGGRLWICDNARLLSVPLDRSGPPEAVDLGTTAGLGDPLAWGGHLYVGYGDEEAVLKISPDGEVARLKGVASINGLAERDGRLFCVTWATHEVYELDPAGEREPVAFGLAGRFENLDGIEVLADGTFVVSDFSGGRLYTIAPDRKTVKVLAEVSTPADILVDHERMVLYVPSYFGGKATIYKLVSE